MSENYRPVDGAKPDFIHGTTILSQRDLSLRVPINFVTTPGVSLSAACFANGIYEDDNAAVCLSNLLAVGFRRFELDLYWDSVRRLWTFCAFAVTSSSVISAPLPTPTTTTDPSSTLSAEITSLTLSDLAARQAISTSSGGSALNASSLGQSVPTLSIIPNDLDTDTPLIEGSPYSCTSTINLSIFTSLLLDFIQETQTNLGAHILYVILNIHAATSANDATSPASTPASYNLPTSESSLSALFTANLSSYLYTPTNLRSDRENLNSSWYQVSEKYRPAEEYYTVSHSPENIVSTEDGWPTESYIELTRTKRLILGRGTVDPQMARYNFTDDDPTIFPSGYIQDIKTDIDATAAGRVTGGCFLRNSTELVSQTNSSWASASDVISLDFEYPTAMSSDIIPLLNFTLNTTQCGISPILNTTLLNTTADANYQPYQNYTYSTIWSWAPNEPRNYTDKLFRCASTNPDLNNRWVVADCSQRYYAACRATNQPYNWTITTYPISYSYADDACPSGYSFAAPRTALENSYLGQEMRSSKRVFDGHGAWVDFNSLDIESCWTSGGPNATCPYSTSVQQIDDLRKRVILVPTIAAIIVFAVTALTIFVKIAGGRKVKKRVRKRAQNGFVYEGVPS